jgi:hypothetical protein
LKESEKEVTFYQFFTEIKNFLKELLVDPHNATTDGFFKSHGIRKGELIKKLQDRDIIQKDEKIDEVDGQSMYTVSYKIPKQGFEKKVHRLYSKMFEGQTNSTTETELNEDGEGAMTGGGMGGAFDGATNANISAASMYDAPVNAGKPIRRDIYAPAMKRKDGKGGSISINEK